MAAGMARLSPFRQYDSRSPHIRQMLAQRHYIRKINFALPPLSLPHFRADARSAFRPTQPGAPTIAMAAAYYYGCRAPLINSVAIYVLRTY